MHSDNDSDSETESDIWPKFLVIEASDPDLPLRKLSPFAVEKGIKGMAGDWCRLVVQRTTADETGLKAVGEDAEKALLIAKVY